MTTIVNTPPASEPRDSSWGPMGVVLALIIALILLFLLVPAFRNSIRNIGSPQIAVPEQVDINVNQPNP